MKNTKEKPVKQIYAVDWEAAGVAFIEAYSAEEAEVAFREHKETYMSTTEDEFDAVAELVDFV